MEITNVFHHNQLWIAFLTQNNEFNDHFQSLNWQLFFWAHVFFQLGMPNRSLRSAGKYFLTVLRFAGVCSRGLMVKAMDCGNLVSEFVLQSRYYVHFRANTLGKGMNPLILPAMG